MAERKIYELLSDSDLWKNLKEKYPANNIINIKPEDETGQIDKINGDCIMLKENLCRIHSEINPRLKPSVCRIFPFIFKAAPDGIYVSVSFHCPAVRENKGNLLIDSVPDLIETLIESGEEFIFEESVRITPDLATDWQGYLLLEAFISGCIKNGDLMDGLWEGIKAVANISVCLEKQNITTIDAKRLAQLLDNQPQTNLEINGEIAVYQVQFTASIISVLELWKRSFEQSNADIILHGGSFLSDTFEQIIKTKPFHEYLRKNADIWNSDIFSNYIRHLIKFRKALLSGKNLLSSLVTLTFSPLIYVWYASVCTELNKKELPEQKELMETLGILDLYLFHLGIFNPMFEKFSEGILWFAGLGSSSPGNS